MRRMRFFFNLIYSFYFGFVSLNLVSISADIELLPEIVWFNLIGWVKISSTHDTQQDLKIHLNLNFKFK